MIHKYLVIPSGLKANGRRSFALDFGLFKTALICSHKLGPQLAQNSWFCANFKRTYCSFKHTHTSCSNASADDIHTRLTETQTQTTLKRKRRPPSSHWTTTLFLTPKSTAAMGYSLSYPLSNFTIFLFHIHIQFGCLEFFTRDEANYWANLVGLIF